MNIRIKDVIPVFLFFSLTVLLQAQVLPGVTDALSIRHYNPVYYVDKSEDTNPLDIVSLPDRSWVPLPESSKISVKEKAVWIKIALPEGALGQDLYLTEHFGIRKWNVFFFSENLLLDHETISWTENLRDTQSTHSQYRGFTSFHVFNSNHKDVVLLVRLEPQYGLIYSLYLRGRVNFQNQYNSWIFLQGVGVGIIVVVILLTLAMSLKLMYKIDWLYLVVVVITGLNISYYTGMGPALLSYVIPRFSHTAWLFLLSLSNLFFILFLEEFSDFPSEKKGPVTYFFCIRLLSILFPVVILFLPAHMGPLIMHFGSLFISLLILAGLIQLVVKHSSQAAWVFTGWLGMILFITLGTILKLNHITIQILPIILFVMGDALLLIFLYTALIKQMDQQRRSELRRRRSAEHMAESILRRMGEHKRMADMGEMVSSVTHELGTPLGVTVTLSSNMTNIGQHIRQLFNKSELSEDDFKQFMTDVLESSELIEKNMENARVLIEGFKQVASDQAAPDIREFNLFHYISQVVRILTIQFKRRPYKLNLNIPGDLTIRSNPGILTQVLTNLINNAIVHGFANRQGGSIDLNARKIVKNDKKYVELVVEDDGNGIPLEIQKKVFNMYFTTRKGFGGTGVGLSIVKSLVEERLKGSISLVSIPEKGTTFTILIPESIEE